MVKDERVVGYMYNKAGKDLKHHFDLGLAV